MKVINEFVRYQYKQYALSAKYVVPLIGLFAVFGIMYSVTPIAVVSNFAIMSLVLAYGCALAIIKVELSKFRKFS